MKQGWSKQRNEHSFLCPIFWKAVPFFISTISHYELFEYWNSLMEKSSTHENIGQSNLYSFHSLASSHLHLTECKLGYISIAQVSTNALLINIIDAIAEQKNTLICNIFLTTIYGAAIPPTRAHREENPTPMVLQEIKYYQVRELTREKALFCCMARSQILGAKWVAWAKNY